MSLQVWNKQSGLLDTIQEGVKLNLQLPSTHQTGITYAVISGKLPPGVWIDENFLRGTPFEVPHDTTFSFCIRASRSGEISDRTYSLLVQGPDAPTFITAEGLLDIGPKQQLYIIDDTFVNYQIKAFDSDTSAGQTLTYYIDPKYGILPPGLSITKTGIIYGTVQSVTSLTPADGTGTYDDGQYDSAPYDFASSHRQNGYDTIPYDKAIYDYFVLNQPKKINRHYRFRVYASDGETSPSTSREFEIFVVTSNYFRADSDASIPQMSLFTADVSYLSQPLWLTPSNLGTYRADNYVTLVLDVYDIGLIYYTLRSTTTTWTPNTKYNVDDLIYINPTLTYICTTEHTSGISRDPTYWVKHGIPPGMSFDDKTGEVFGRVPRQPATSVTYTFSITASRHGDEDTDEIAETTKTFTVTLVGDIENSINWITLSDLGSINAETPSALYVRAVSTDSATSISHTLIDGRLPTGLTLVEDGEIVGSAFQFSSSVVFDRNKTTFTNTTFNQTNSQLGLTTFSDDYNTKTKTMFDNNTTTFDRSFTFTVRASDQLNYSVITRTFTLKVNTPNDLQYSNIRVQPLLTPDHLTTWKTFINSGVFTFESIYRPYDPNYGIQTNLSMLIFEGIETRRIADYYAITTDYRLKQFRFGEVKKAVAVIPGTKTELYEVVYIEMIDPTIVNSVAQWRNDLSIISEPRYDSLPLWMRSIQPSERKELGFVLAIPLCFCKVGTADTIILNIKYSTFDFKLIDYRIDRFTINAITGSNTDKYIIFNNKETI